MKNKKAFRYSLSSKAFVIGAIVIVLLLNAIFITLSNKISLEIDFTQDKIFDLTKESEQIVDLVTEPIEILVLTTGVENEGVTTIQNILSKYAQRNSKITIREVDVVKNPAELKAYTLPEGLAIGSLIIKQGEDYKVLNSMDFFTSTGLSYVERMVSTQLATLVDGLDPVTVYFTTGHGEQCYTNTRPVLEASGYKTAELNLLTEEAPEIEKSLLIISAPGTDFAEAEIEKLDAYLGAGGDVQIYFDPLYAAGEFPVLKTYLKNEWGIEVYDDVVLDGADVIENSMYMLAKAPGHEITDPITESKKNIGYTPSNSLEIVADKPVSVSIQPLITTGDKAFAKTSTRALTEGNMQKESGDKEGPFNLVVLAARQLMTTESEQAIGNLLVSGSALTFDALVADGRFANEDVLLNSVSWMKGGDATVTVRVKQIPGGALAISKTQFWAWFSVLVVVVPLALLAAGIVVFVKRRYK